MVITIILTIVMIITVMIMIVYNISGLLLRGIAELAPLRVLDVGALALMEHNIS